MKPAVAPDPEAVESAKEAGLRYVTDSKPGIQRRARGNHFLYIAPGERTLRDPADLDRIKRLAIPPAWENVWICPSENGHLQASGRDARGRKQYRYHTRWRETRDETKFERMTAFGKALPKIRRRVTRDLALRGMPREKVLATIVRLLETTLIRVGNEEYARENHSFGLTTMRNRHVDVSAATIRFQFKGKSGKTHEISVHDRRLANIVRRLQDIPGYEVFEYIDETGQAHGIDSADVNAYLREISGYDCTAKDFRTWAGTVLAMVALREFEKFRTDREAKSNIKTAIEAVARMLGNTPTVCRKCYIHPEVLDSYIDGSLLDTLRQRAREKIARSLARLKPEEAAVMMLLEQRLTAARRAKTRTHAL